MNVLPGNFAFRQRIRAHKSVFNLLEEVEYRAVETQDDLEDVFRLRYKAYHSKGYIASRADKQCFDDMDGEENSRIFGIYRNGELISSIRIHLIEKIGQKSPSMHVFPEVLERKINEGSRFIDSSRFVIDPALDIGADNLYFVVLRISVLACVHHQVDYSLSLVRPSHGPFYRRYFGFDPWAEGGTFPGVTFGIDLFSANIAKVHDRVLHRLPFLHSLPAERRLLFDREIGKRSCYSVRSTARLAVEAIDRGQTLSETGGAVPAFA